MKIRSDYVSNSSSSSFVLIGEKMDASKFDIETFETLGNDEVFLLVLPNRGSEGDYMFVLTPELLMDFDMHQINLAKSSLPLIKVKYYLTEGGYLYRATALKKMESDEYDWDSGDDDLSRKFRNEGMEFPVGCKMFRFDKDYGNPRDRAGILEEIETALKYY